MTLSSSKTLNINRDLRCRHPPSHSIPTGQEMSSVYIPQGAGSLFCTVHLTLTIENNG